MAFAEKLRRLMDVRRISQATMAAAVGVSQAQVSKWARGINTPDIGQGMAIARTFGVSLDYLADDAQEGPPPEPSETRKTIEQLIRVVGEEEALARLAGRYRSPDEPRLRGRPAE
jgi:transcriptional regulator with XRE-family HTH domain